MTRAGEDILAWTKAAIDHAESVARLACDDSLGHWHNGPDPDDPEPQEYERDLAGVSDDRGRTVVYDEGRPSKEQSDHVVLNDPASVLRRCAADRKILKLHCPDRIGDCIVCAHEEQEEEDSQGHVAWFRSAMTYPCPTALAVAEGYGWTEGER